MTATEKTELTAEQIVLAERLRAASEAAQSALRQTSHRTKVQLEHIEAGLMVPQVRAVRADATRTAEALADLEAALLAAGEGLVPHDVIGRAYRGLALDGSEG